MVDADPDDPGAGKSAQLHLVEVLALRSQQPDAHPPRPCEAAKPGGAKKNDLGELGTRHGEVASRQRERLRQKRSTGIPARRR